MSENNTSSFWNLPNLVSFSRIAAVPVMMVLLAFDDKMMNLATAIFFILVCITDWLDGYLARKMKIITSIGKFLDPLADKILIASVFIMLIPMGRIDAWVVALILAREMAVTGLRSVAASDGVVIAASQLGKIKTVSQIVCIVPLIIHYTWYGFDFHLIGLWLLVIAVILTVYSGADYFIKFFKSFNSNSKEV